LNGNKQFQKKTLFLILFVLADLFFLTGCPRPAMRTSRTYFAPPCPVQAPQGFYHTLEKGQTVYHIAKLYHVSVNEIMVANNIHNVSGLVVGQKLFIPQQGYGQAPPSRTGTGPVSPEDALCIIGPKHNNSYWRTITVHHSGTFQGSARGFDNNHRHRGMGGLFYHFVIGNGTATGDGEVEVGFRWIRQIKSNRPNDINICLVGNFDEQDVSQAQFNTLVNMIRALQQEYDIPNSNVRQHRDIPGKHTDCPGKRFPFQRLMDALNGR